MPVYLRKWYYKQLNETYKDEAEQQKKQNKKSSKPSRAGISR
tara:strand:+ start:216 stop:341 length:126 start_codon:yes stop_codon:yes gene_type:complete